VATEGEGEEKPDTYVPPPPVTVDALLAKDAEDESLRRYKAALLGGAGEAVVGDGRQVIGACVGL